MHDDEELRSRFSTLAGEDAAATPPFSRGPLDARLRARLAPHPWYTARNLAVIGVSGVGVAAALSIGLVLGANTGYASGRVEGERQASEIAGAMMSVTTGLAALRLDLDRARSEMARRAADKGAVPQAAFKAAEAELRAMEESAARISLDLTQSQDAPTVTSSRNIPMKRAIAITCGALAIGAQPSPVARLQQGVPIVDLPPAPAKTSTSFGVLLGVREVSGGKLLVNDGRRRQLKLYDTTLANGTVVMDSVAGSATSYGPRPLPLLAYLGDSSLSADVNAGTLLMLDGAGQVARAVASPYVQDVPPYGNLTTSLRMRYSGVDTKGRILFQGLPALTRPGATIEERVAALGKDSIPIMRADMESRRVDTIAFVKSGGQTALLGRPSPDAPVKFSRMPVEMVDVWGVLSDGSIGIVRGQDYHIDWILPDGTKRSTAKLPFDWKRLTDEDKQRLIDSVRVDASRLLGNALAQGQAAAPRTDAGGGGSGTPGTRVYVPPEQRTPRTPLPMEYVPPALKDIPDYYPSVRIAAAIADLDGNLWILPNSSAQSKNGELVYDVVNPNGDFHRVRVPLGTSIAGFGKGGVVYLQSGDNTNGFYLERTRVPNKK
jgi:hypothetical protein